ncbi:MAG: methyltransferase domain-containing protein [Rhizobiales bacterium]|nr:methyltransferase domain-containing protein [Hyphomicrobiales bacterium]
MNTSDRQAHWEHVYATKSEGEVSWFQDNPTISLQLIAATGAGLGSAIIDVGGGASRLVDALVAGGHQAVTVLDLSDAALATAKARLGSGAQTVTWIAADVTTWNPTEQYDVWHDRAAFHFLTDRGDRDAYVARLTKALRWGEQAIIGTFSLQGPERCSGLSVVRYDARSLGEILGPAFQLLETRDEEHRTPWGSSQHFQFSRFGFAGC